MIVIGLTGGIASGKSTAAAALRQLGAPVLDADVVAHDVIEPGQPAYADIVRRFGDGVLLPGHGKPVDRAALGRVVFHDPQARRDLERIVHPRVDDAMQKWLERQREAHRPAAVLEVPLLFESGWNERVDEVWVVDAPESVQLKRIVARNGLSPEEAQARLAAQAPREVRLHGAHRVFPNHGDMDALRKAVAEAWLAVARQS